MASRREVRCRCGRRMWVQPDARTVQCSTCHTVTQLYSLVDIARGANRIIHGFQQLLRQHQPQHHEQQQQQMMAQPPPRLLEPLPSPFGKKRAVLCGVNYKGKSYSLKGCISDAKSMRSLLVQQMGFPIDSILMLTEDEASPQRIPTKRNIKKAMRWVIEGNRARDSLVFHFSGHGSEQNDYNGDEIDGQDEALCPLDHETEGKIIDDEINRILVRPLVHGAKLHAVIDACNSGTVLDLPFICRMERNGSYEWEDHRSVRAYKGTDGGAAFCFSACDDDESSGYTPVFTGKNTGAMTYSFIKAVKTAGPAPTYGHLLNLMCSAIREAQSRLAFNGDYTSSDASAEPLLTSSEEFDVYATKFVL
nr:metacaspase 3 [Arabidopsis thaliana]